MKLLLTLTFAVGLISCSSYEQVATKTAATPSEAAASSSSSSPKAASLEREILVGINDYRSTIGKKAMERHRGLDAPARQHSEFMMRNAGKFGLEGKTITHYGFSSRAARARHSLGMSTMAENVISGHDLKGSVSEKFVTGWIGSPNHLHNIKGKWGYTGVGVVVAPDGAVFATQLFGQKGISHHEKFGLPDIW